MAIRTKNYTLGRGEVSLARFAPGTQNPLGFRYIGNTPSFGFTSASQELDHYNADHGVGELDFSIATQVTRSGTLVTDDIQIDNLATQFFGAKQTVTQTAATAATESFVGVLAGYRYQLGMTTTSVVGVRNVTNVVVKVGAVAKVLGTDYLVDLARGLITVVDGGTIVSGTDTIVVTYDRVASSFDQILSGSTPVEGAMMFVADNPTGANIDYMLPWVRLTPNGEFALKAENALQSLSYSLKILTPSGKAAIYANGQPYIAS